MISFENDYIQGAHPEILKRLAETNLEPLSGYGSDPYCESAREKIRRVCGSENAEVHFLAGGTQTNAVVIDSCDFAQTKSLTKKLAADHRPSYMRLIRKGFTTVYADGSEFEIGKGVTLKNGTDVTVIASGILVDEALKAEELLAKDGISARVIDMHTWKPLDEELILKAAAETGCIVTAENHQVSCGLGAAVKRADREMPCAARAHRHPEPLRTGRPAGFPDEGVRPDRGRYCRSRQKGDRAQAVSTWSDRIMYGKPFYRFKDRLSLYSRSLQFSCSCILSPVPVK